MSATGEGHFGEKDRCQRELGGGTRALRRGLWGLLDQKKFSTNIVEEL